MRIKNDPVQNQMLLDAIDFSNISRVGFPRLFIHSFQAETIVTAPVANCLATTGNGLLKQDFAIF
jgi:hypothetical protein